jgi:hypothetical protein
MPVSRTPKGGKGLGLPQESEKVRGKTKDRALFNATVLELVKLIQAGLFIFGLYGSRFLPDGLLCDNTVEGIRRWIITIGEPCVGLEVRTLASYATNT